jgi:catechol 2,3-dioxygenase-like lactoylglutathione lyase family enzyme
VEVYGISAVTLFVKSMKKSCDFYSQIPGFRLVYGGSTDAFTSFELYRGDTLLNLQEQSNSNEVQKRATDFGRIIFHTNNVDRLYQHLRDNAALSKLVFYENDPVDAPWGERFFHLRDPDDYQLSFAQPIKNTKGSTLKRGR